MTQEPETRIAFHAVAACRSGTRETFTQAARSQECDEPPAAWLGMSTNRVSTCSTCRHSARGTAVDLRPEPTGRPPNPMRPSLRGGDYICSRNGLTPAKVNPVTGFQALPSGPDCRDLNPDGACEHYQRGVQPSDVLVAGTVLVLAGFLLALAGL